MNDAVSDTKRAIIIDCDPGHDDAVAIVLALGTPSIEVRGISTVFGNCAVTDGTRNALDILHLVGRDDVPVVQGASGPLTGEPVLGNYVHGRSGLDGPQLEPSSVRPHKLGAVSWMAGQLDGSTDPITIVATGPLTNIAELLTSYPQARDNIAEVIFMGGSTERGNHTPYAEFNTYADPEALRVVLESGVRSRMVGLNLTHQALATSRIVEELRTQYDRIGEVMADWMGFFRESYRAVWSFDAPPVHDPCTVAALIAPEIVGWEEAFVGVEVSGEWTRGATAVDLDNRWPDKEPNAHVAVSLDADRYWRLIFDAIDRLEHGIQRAGDL